MSISAIALASLAIEKILDLVDHDKADKNILPCLDKNIHKENPVISSLRFRQICSYDFLAVLDLRWFQDCIG